MSRPLLVSHTGQPGGSNVVLLDLLTERPPDVEPACLFLAPGEVEGHAASLGAAVAVVETGRAREAWKAPRAVRALRGAIRAHRADVVFAHTTKAHVYASAAAALEGVPYLWWQHKLPGQEPALDAVADRLPAAAIVCSSHFTAALQRARTPRARVRTIHPGTRVPPVPPERPDGPPRVVLVARLQRWKRVELLLRAVPRVLDAVPEARFEILGGADPAVDPGYDEELRAEAAALGVDAAVTFAGHVPDARDRIAGAAVLAHTAYREPFGLIYLEALARRVPVVAPRAGGSAEIVRDGVDGLLVDVEDPGAFAGAIAALVRDPDRRARLGASGRDRVLERFTVERMAAEAWDLVHAVARDRP